MSDRALTRVQSLPWAPWGTGRWIPSTPTSSRKLALNRVRSLPWTPWGTGRWIQSTPTSKWKLALNRIWSLPWAPSGTRRWIQSTPTSSRKLALNRVRCLSWGTGRWIPSVIAFIRSIAITTATSMTATMSSASPISTTHLKVTISQSGGLKFDQLTSKRSRRFCVT